MKKRMERLIARVRAHRTEEGSAILLALVFVVTIALVLSATSGFLNTGLLTTTQLVAQRDYQMYLDGAVQGAANAIRNDPLAGVQAANGGRACGPYSPASPAAPDRASSGYSFNVQCSALPVPVTETPGNNAPLYAIETLGSGNGEGINGSGELNVDGNVATNGTFGPGTSVNVTGDVVIKGASCSSITSNVTWTGKCIPNKTSADPAYTAGAAGAPFTLPTTVDPAPVCVNSSVVEFYPGYYSEVPRPLPGSTCAGASVYWFSNCPVGHAAGLCPGASDGYYYFDFPDANAQWSLGPPSPPTIIAGTPTGTWLTTGNPTVPGACSTAATDSGVQFIFGGPAWWNLKHDTIEICSPHPSSGQQIALYGISSGTRPTAASSVGPNATAADPGTAGDAPYLPATSTGTAAIPSKGTGDITFGFSSSAIPAGAVITKATVTVVHSVAVGGPVTPSFTVSLGQTELQSPPAAQSPNFGSCSSGGSPCSDSYDFTSALPQDFAYQAIDGFNGGSGVTVEFKAKAGTPAATDTIGSVTLAVSYLAPALEGMRCADTGTTPASCSQASATLSGALTSGTTYTSLSVHSLGQPVTTGESIVLSGGPGASQTVIASGDVPVNGTAIPVQSFVANAAYPNKSPAEIGWESISNEDNQVTMAVHGTAYVPTAELDVFGFNKGNKSGVPSQLFDRGVLVLSLNVSVSASFKQTSSIFQLNVQPTVARLVQLTGQVTFPGQTSPTNLLVAVIAYTDTTPSGMAFPGYGMTVQSWTVLR